MGDSLGGLLRLTLLVTIMVVVFLSLARSSLAYGVDRECVAVYFLNAIHIENSSYGGRLYLETPVNLSLGSLNQTVRTITSKGVLYDPDVEAYAIDISEGTPTYAYVLLEVRVCSPEYGEVLNLLKAVMLVPQAFLNPASLDLGEELRSYLGTPPQVVVSIVVRDFEDWLRTMPWYYTIGNLSSYPLILAVHAAKFIYGGSYIRYSPSLLPRTTEEVVEAREGDCDDMSRILLSLMWYYGIPATIAYGFVAIPGYIGNSTIGSFTYVFSNGGPHAFILAYIADYGWLSLDLLAGSLLLYPVALWGLSSRVLVEREEVEKAEELHRAIHGKQLIASLEIGDLRELSTEALESYINSTLGLRKEVPPEVSPTSTDQLEQSATVATASTRPELGGLGRYITVVPLLLALLLALLVVLLRKRASRG